MLVDGEGDSKEMSALKFGALKTNVQNKNMGAQKLVHKCLHKNCQTEHAILMHENPLCKLKLNSALINKKLTPKGTPKRTRMPLKMWWKRRDFIKQSGLWKTFKN
jgi:hypothetical protein